MLRRLLIFFAMTGIYVWIRGRATDVPAKESDADAQSTWADEGGANLPAA